MNARREVDLGELSGGESAYSGEAAVRGEEHRARVFRDDCELAQKHYEAMLATARTARKALSDFLLAGVPALAPLATGGYDGLIGLRQADACRLINALVWANVSLRAAAQWLADAEDMSDDDAQALTWEMPL